MKLEVHLSAETAEEVKEIALMLSSLTGVTKCAVVDSGKKQKPKGGKKDEEPSSDSGVQDAETQDADPQDSEAQDPTTVEGPSISDIRALASEKINASTKDAIRAKLKELGGKNIDSLADQSAENRQLFYDFLSAL